MPIRVDSKLHVMVIFRNGTNPEKFPHALEERRAQMLDPRRTFFAMVPTSANLNSLYDYLPSQNIDQILRSKADYIPFEDEIANPNMPAHDNIRGQDYYE